MSARIHVRQTGRARRGAGPRRASAGLTPARALAALVVLATAGAAWGVTGSPVFALQSLEITGVSLTATAEVDSAVGVAVDGTGPSSFSVRTDEVRDRLLVLPTVADARVSVALPGHLRIQVTEREPILVWACGHARLLVDRDGRVVEDAAAADATDAARALAASLPTVNDTRTSRWPLADDWRPVVRQAPRVGSDLQPLELGIARQLLSLRPADVGSTALTLAVAVDDVDGWVLAPVDGAGWTAVFGFYSTTLRSPELVASQVRLLRSLLTGRETQVGRVMLGDARHGTVGSPAAGSSARPSGKASARPSAGHAAKPSANASAQPSAKRSAKPSARPSPKPSAAP